MGRLEGKTCLITGGAGSLGAAAARLFVEHGASVVLVDRDAGGLDRVVRTLPPERTASMVGDVTDTEVASAYVGLTLDRFGGIDVLFSNAGNFGTVKPIADYPDHVFDSVMAVHVKGAYLAAKYASPHMRKGSSIVITSSVAGMRGDAGVYAYITAKHAQVGLMRCLAKELAPRGIRVNTIHPGPIDNGFQLAVEQGIGRRNGRRRHRLLQRHDPARPARLRRGGRPLGALSRQRQFQLRHRRDADGGRRHERLTPRLSLAKSSRRRISGKSCLMIVRADADLVVVGAAHGDIVVHVEEAVRLAAFVEPDQRSLHLKKTRIGSSLS